MKASSLACGRMTVPVDLAFTFTSIICMLANSIIINIKAMESYMVLIILLAWIITSLSVAAGMLESDTAKELR